MRTNKVVFKYPLDLVEHQYVNLPLGFKILSIQVQGNKACMWALVDKTQKNVHKGIICVGTGNPIAHNLGDFIATVQMGMYVWHFFEGEEINVSIPSQ